MTDEIAIRTLDLGDSPVRVVNGVGGLVYFGSLFDLILTQDRAGVGEDGNLTAERLIVSRLRFDVEMARIIRDRLNAAIASLTVPADTKPN